MNNIEEIKLQEQKKSEITCEGEVFPMKTNDPADKILIDERFITKNEKEFITFSKNGVMKFLKSFEDENLVPWTPLYNKNNLELHYRKGVRTLIIIESFKQRFFSRKKQIYY